MSLIQDRRQHGVPVAVERRGVRRAPTSHWGWTAYMGLLAALFAGLALWLLSRHYLNDSALWNWSTVVGGLDAPQGGFNRFVLLYPQVQYYLLAVVSLIPGLKSPQMSYLMSAVTGAGLLTHFTLRLRHMGLPLPMIVTVVLLIALNPVFLWGTTSGGNEMFGITLYYALGLSMIQLRYSHSLHAHMVLGLVLLLFFITDGRSLYLSLTLLPLLPLIVQKHILRLSLVAPIVVLYFPLLFMIGIWVALNWIYAGDSLACLKDPASPFLGSRMSSEYLSWRASYGTQFWSPTAITALLLLVCYPVLLLVQLPSVRHSRLYIAALVLAVMPVIASGLATWAKFTQSPADMLVFVIGGVMALLISGMLLRDHPLRVIALLFAGMLGSLTLFQWHPAVGMVGWFDTLAGRIQESPHQGDLELGLWSRSAQGMMLDENTGYAVIGARGNAEDLYLTFSDRFKQGINGGRLIAEWVAVPSPLRDPQHRDQVAHNFPRLYEEGMVGYTLAYDRDGWRVYAREDSWSGATPGFQAAP